MMGMCSKCVKLLHMCMHPGQCCAGVGGVGVGGWEGGCVMGMCSKCVKLLYTCTHPGQGCAGVGSVGDVILGHRMIFNGLDVIVEKIFSGFNFR